MRQIIASDKEQIRDAIIARAIDNFSITKEEFFGEAKTRKLVAARAKAANELARAGFTPNRIGQILGRSRKTVENYFEKSKTVRQNRLSRQRLLRHLSEDLCLVVSEYAKAEGINIDVLVAQWVGERAAHELAAKQREAP